MELKSAFDWKPLPEVIDEERDGEREETVARFTPALKKAPADSSIYDRSVAEAF